MFTLPELPYNYDAVEPHIDAKTMEIHHTKHHQTYIDKLNAALEDQEGLAGSDINALLQRLDEVPVSIRMTVRNNGGGHANHSFFWPLLSPDGGGEPQGDMAAKLKSSFGSFDEFKKKFKEEAIAVFGSGWTWLVIDNGELKITATGRQDSPVMQGIQPVLGLDLWEHAYYLKYQNKRPDYVDAWWNVVNWEQVQKNYEAATSS